MTTQIDGMEIENENEQPAGVAVNDIDTDGLIACYGVTVPNSMGLPVVPPLSDIAEEAAFNGMLAGRAVPELVDPLIAGYAAAKGQSVADMLSGQADIIRADLETFREIEAQHAEAANAEESAEAAGQEPEPAELTAADVADKPEDVSLLESAFLGKAVSVVLAGITEIGMHRLHDMLATAMMSGALLLLAVPEEMQPLLEQHSQASGMTLEAARESQRAGVLEWLEQYRAKQAAAGGQAEA